MKKNKILPVALYSLLLISCSKNVNNNNSSSISISTSSSTPVENKKVTTSSSFIYTLFTDNKTAYVEGLDDDSYTHVVIPDYINGIKITAVSSSLFKNCTNVKYVYINSFIKSITGATFQYVSDTILEVEISPDNENFTIENNCIVSKNLRYNNRYVYFCYGDFKIPTEVPVVLYDSCFAYKKNLKSVYIPENVISINEKAFQYTSNLESIEVSENNPNYRSLNNCLVDKSKVVAGTINSVIPTDPSITSLGLYSFCGSNIKKLFVPKNITSLPFAGNNAVSYVFYESALEELVFDDDINLGENGLNYTIKYLNNLKEFKYPKSITQLTERNAISNCDNIEKVILPDNVTSITGSSFYMCHNIKEIVLNNNPSLEIVDNKFLVYTKADSTKTLVKYLSNEANVMLPEVDEIDYYTFSSNPYIKEVTLSNTIKKIGQCAFWRSSLETINFNDAITSIGDSCFRYLNNLKTFTWPKSITEIKNSSVIGDSKIEKFILPKEVTSVNNNSFYLTDVNELVVEEGGKFSSKNNCLFNNDTKAVQLAFPIKGTKKVVLPSGTIGSGSYAFTRDIEEVEFNDEFIRFANYSFWNSSIKHIEIPDQVVEIPNYCFTRSAKLESIKLSNNLTTIGDQAFSSCKMLKSIEIPDSVTTIGGSAFSSTGIESIKLSNNIKALPTRLLSNCKNLKSISIPESVTEISTFVFEDTNIEDIEIKNPNITLAAISFNTSSIKRIKFNGTIQQFKALFHNSESEFIDNFKYSSANKENKLETITLLENGNEKTVDVSIIYWGN